MDAPELKQIKLIKRNRKYYAALLEGKYNCKVIIDDASDDLSVGVDLQLEVEELDEVYA